MNFCRFLSVLLALAAPMLATPGACASEDSRVTIQLKWRHQFQFAGYYAAIEQGYFRDAGLDVTLREAEEGEDPVHVVTGGRADYGIGTSELVVSRANGAPLVALAATYQHSPSGIATLRGRGIDTVHGLAGKRVMVEPQAAEIWAYLKTEGIAADRMTLVPHTFDTKSLIAGDVDAMTVYTTDETFALAQAGLEFQLFSARSVDIDFYSDVLFTTEAEIAAHPARAAALLDAVRHGWHYAMAHPDEMARLIRARYSERKSLDHLLYEAEHSRPLMALDVVEFGYMNEGRWRHIADTYASLGMIKPGPSLDGFLYRPDTGMNRETVIELVAGMALAVLLVSGIGGRFYALSRRLRHEVAVREGAEAELRAALAQERNILSILAHDFRTPLSVISASAQLIGYCLSPHDSRGQREIGKISVATRKLSDLIASCLAKDRLEGLAAESFLPVDLPPLIERLVEEWRTLYPHRRIYLDMTDLARDETVPTTVNGDRGLLTVAFSNLIDNALKYAPPDGRVILALGPGPSVDTLTVTVSDDGPGIPEEDRERVFEKYYRSPGTLANGGAGIGLSVVAGVARAHKGTVVARSGARSEFVMTLPALKEALA
ncbi:MAG: ABC transporter substrate-binding protein [Hyphomicrobium sp.]|jgi:signal transduction histidine kinase